MTAAVDRRLPGRWPRPSPSPALGAHRVRPAQRVVLFVTTAGQLIAVRAALGVAAAGMAPVTMSLVYRLFDDERLRMRAITLMIVVGMSGFALGPILAGSMLSQLAWHWLLAVNLPVAAIAVLGVRIGIPADAPGDLHDAPLDAPGAVLTMLMMGSTAYVLTSGVEHGWTAPLTLLAALVAVASTAGFVRRERTAEHPMLDLTLLANRTIRGAALAQLGGSVAMIGAIFALTLHFQDAYGWSPMRAGLANLPFVVTMLLATPVAEQLAARLGHRIATLVAAATLTVSLAGMAWAVPHGYAAIAAAMVGMTIGLRTIMTICAIALVDAMPVNRTSVGAALNDTAQEVGTSVGIAVVGTVLAAALGTAGVGGWDSATIAAFLHGERLAFVLLAVIVGLVATYGANTLTDSRSIEES